jgi:tRNA (guanine37-N1)-methyltransferase
MVVIDAVIRLVPGVLGDEESHQQDSFSGQRRWLEFAQYTRPREYRGLTVPEILLGGNHPAIARWREEESLRKTRERRADLIDDTIANKPAQNSSLPSTPKPHRSPQPPATEAEPGGSDESDQNAREKGREP